MSIGKRLTTIILVFIIAIGISAFSNGNAKTHVEFRPWAGYVAIGPGELPVLYWGWGSCSEGLSWDFLDAVVQNVYVYQDGVLVGEYLNAGEWGDPYASGASEACLHGDGTIWSTFMTFEDLDIDDAGIYEVHTEFYLSFPVTDGGDSDGDGFLDLYNPYRYWITTVEVFE